ncbi:MAG: glycosyltransferase [Hydrogenophilales bacterium]|nr:glycosyltransferase [Hydrogenophilales bacterium]
MPAYNHAAYVRAAVDSVLGQTYSNLELIVIDDASSDGTWEVLMTFSDPRMRCFRHETNQGAHATLNEGVSLAKGQIISILNSDDVYSLERLRLVISVLSVEPELQAVVTQYDFLDTFGAVVKDAASLAKEFPDATKGIGDEAMQISSLELQTLSLLARNYFHTTSNLVMRREVVSRVGPFRSYRYVHDHDFFLRLSILAPVRMIDESHLGYRMHATNTLSENPAVTVTETAGMLTEFMLTHEIHCLRRYHPAYAAVLAYLLETFRGYGAERLMLFLALGEVAGSVNYRALTPLFDGYTNAQVVHDRVADLLLKDRAAQDLRWQSEQTTYWWEEAQKRYEQLSKATTEKDKSGHALWEANYACWLVEQELAVKVQELSVKERELAVKEQELWKLKQDHWAVNEALWQAEQDRNFKNQQVTWLQGHSQDLELALSELHTRHERILSVRVVHFLRRMYAYFRKHISDQSK